MRIRYTALVARSRNHIIGRNGRLPWKMPSDLRRFRERTLAKPLIIGRKTYDNLSGPLKGRYLIVVSRSRPLSDPPKDVCFAASIADAIAMANSLAAARRVNEVIIAGGSSIYQATLPYLNQIEITELNLTVEGDALFANPDPKSWRETSRFALATDPAKDQAEARVRIFTRYDVEAIDRDQPSPHGL